MENVIYTINIKTTYIASFKMQKRALENVIYTINIKLLKPHPLRVSFW